MKRRYVGIIVCIVLICMISLFLNFIKEDKSKDINAENPKPYSVDYKEYREAQWNKFKIFVPYVLNLGNQELEEHINEVLEKEAITWLIQDDSFSNFYQPQEPHVWCQTEKVLSIELTYENVGGRSTTFVNQYVTINMQDGNKLSFKQLIKNENMLISLLQDGESIYSLGTIYDKNQSESDSYIRRKIKNMPEEDVKKILDQCMLSQEKVALYDEDLGEPTVYNRSYFFMTEDAMVITYVEHGYCYYIALALETLENKGLLTMNMISASFPYLKWGANFDRIERIN